MDNGKPVFQKMLGGSNFKVFPGEIRYDPLFGKPSDKHWAIPRTALRDVTCEKKWIVYTLRIQTDTAMYEVPNVADMDVVQVVSLIMPEKFQTDPLLRDLLQRRDAKIYQEQQRAYEKQLAAYQQSLQPEQIVWVYKHNPEKDFQKDAARLARDGWVVQSQTAGGMKSIDAANLITLGLAGSRRVGEITVVYTRPRKPLPMPMPPSPPASSLAVAATPIPAPVPRTEQAPQPDLMTQLEKLGELHEKGILTDEEFAAKKADILARM